VVTGKEREGERRLAGGPAHGRGPFVSETSSTGERLAGGPDRKFN
jgi:hypothetical protein